MSPRDVEAEIYERLYGASPHGPRGDRAAGERILIGNTDLPAAPGEGTDSAHAPIRRASRGSGRRAPRGRGGATGAGEVLKAVANGIRSEAATGLAGAAGRGRDAVRRARPALAAPLGRTRDELRRPARTGADPGHAPPGRLMALAVLAAGLIGVSLVVALTSSGGPDRQARQPIVHTTPTEVPKLSPGPASPLRRSSPRARAVPRHVSAAPAAIQRTNPATKLRRRSVSKRTAPRKPTRRSTGSHPPARRPAPTQKETSPTSPAPPASTQPPTATTPPTTGAGGTQAGGAPAPPEPAG